MPHRRLACARYRVLFLNIVISQGILGMLKMIAATESGRNNPFPLEINVAAAEPLVSYSNQAVSGRTGGKELEFGRGDDFSGFAHHAH